MTGLHKTLKMSYNILDIILTYSVFQQWELQHNPEFRLITNPSANGYGTARGVAKLYGILTSGGAYS